MPSKNDTPIVKPSPYPVSAHPLDGVFFARRRPRGDFEELERQQAQFVQLQSAVRCLRSRAQADSATSDWHVEEFLKDPLPFD